LRNPNLLGLVRNEVVKIGSKRRFAVVSIILVILVSMFTYAQYRQIEEQLEKQGTLDWRVELQQDIVDTPKRPAPSSHQEEFQQVPRVHPTPKPDNPQNAHTPHGRRVAPATSWL